MKQAWFSTQELLSIARRKKWNRRCRQGAQGRGMEYAFDSLPAAVQQALLRREMRDGAEAEWTLDAPAAGVPASLATCIAIYRQLTVEEREQVIAFVMREKVSARLSCVWDCRESNGRYVGGADQFVMP
ncbi:DNA-binding protein [Sodalis glossinidius]|nr:DNA-binding protein [Sodalis glossinidius]